MSENQQLAASIATFLKSPEAVASLTPDQAESLSVAALCIEIAFGLENANITNPANLLEVWRRGNSSSSNTNPMPVPPFPFATASAAAFVTQVPPPVQQPTETPPPVSPEAKAEAEGLKNEGNNLMKAEKFTEALEKYTQAIALDGGNAIYYSNRAAAHSSMKNNEAAIQDCKKALALNPKYGRAYGRLGLALTNLDRHTEAREAYRIACQLEPNNEAYRNNLAVTEETLRRRQPQFPDVNLDIRSLLQNQALANVAAQMLSDPNLQNFMTRLLGEATTPSNESQPAEGTGNNGGGVGLDALLQAGQQLAQQMQQANPELVEQLRRQMGGNGGGPPSQNPPPKPPQ